MAYPDDLVVMLTRASVRAAVVGTFLLGGVTWPSTGLGRTCLRPQIQSLPQRDPQLLPVGATLWVMADDVQDDFLEPECRFVATGPSEDVEASLVLHPAEPGGADSAGSGCAVSGRRFRDIGEVVPQDPLTAGESYTIVCGQGDDARAWPQTWLATDDSPPSFEGLELVVEQASKWQDPCERDRYLRLVFRPIDDRFFSSGGLVLVEYGTNRLDVIRGVEQHSTGSIAIVDLPLPDDETITLRAISGMGAEIGSWVVSVAGLGEEGEGGCRASGRAPGGLALVALVVLATAARRRRPPRPSAPRRG